MEQKNDRIIFLIVAAAWFVILGPLLIASIKDIDPTKDFALLFAIIIALASFIGSIAIIFYKRWGVILYGVSSIILILYASYSWVSNDADSFPWGLIIVNLVYAGTIHRSKEKFGFAQTPVS